MDLLDRVSQTKLPFAELLGIAFISAIGGLGALITPPIFGYLIQRTGSIAAGSLYIAVILICGSLAVLSIKLAPIEKR